MKNNLNSIEKKLMLNTGNLDPLVGCNLFVTS